MDEQFLIRINKLEWNMQTGGVVTVHWEMVATDGEKEGVDKKKTDLDPNPESSNFIPVENVTEELVISWLENTLLEEQMQIYKDRALSNLNKLKMPPLVYGLPWEMN